MKMAVGFVFVSVVLGAAALKVVPDLASGADHAASVETTPPVPAALSLGGRKVAIPMDPSGHYLTEAVVDGHTIAVVVDTGASTVALTAEAAGRLGIRLAEAEYTHPMATANGVVNTALVTLSEVRIGAIAVRDVRAVVVPGDGLAANLLGMTFLNRLRKFEVGGGQLVLSD